MHVEAGIFIDARGYGNTSRFINSSCKPNCDCFKFVDPRNGETRVGIFTKYDLPKDVELTYDYSFHELGEARTFVCGCGDCDWKLQGAKKRRVPTTVSAKNERLPRRVVDASSVPTESSVTAEQSNSRTERAQRRYHQKLFDLRTK
jgi:hypothetical protein